MKPIDRIIISFLILVISNVVLANSKINSALDSLYREAQREFYKQNYTGSLTLLEKYLTESKNKKYKEERLFWVIDQIGRIYLRVKRNPDASIKFFEKVLKDKMLNDAHEDDLMAWLNAAKDWKKYSKMPKTVTNPEELFEIGKLFYDKANQKKSHPADVAGNAYYSIAKAYLMYFLINNEKHPKVGIALFMVGDIQSNIKTDPDYWIENFYLKEVIRRYPNTKLALKAYKKLEEDIYLGYTGSSGNNTPPSIKRMLRSYKKLAEPKGKKVAK